MSHLAVTLFGGFRAELDGKTLTAFGTDKNRALLAYLVVESDHSHRREALANLLWSDHPESAAHNSLRQALYQLRRIVDPELVEKPHLLITPNQVQFNLASDYCIDVIEFKSRLMTCKLHHPDNPNLCTGCLENLQRAVDLYRGDMLAGLTLPRCAELTDWMVISQEVYHRQALAALSLLADCFEAALDYDQLIACTQRKIELEPWRESAYRRQMMALAMTGQREQALLKYKILQEVLQREIGISPTDGIRHLYEHIRDGDFPGGHPEQGELFTPVSPTYHPTAAIAAPFVGRQSELAQLDCFRRDYLAGQGRVAFIRGEAGSGKTALLNEFARRAMRAHSDLLVFIGTCSTYSGLGDPFQPFREIFECMIGIAAVTDAGDRVSKEFARRLSFARPVLLQTLLQVSPGLAGILLPTFDLQQQAIKKTKLDAAIGARLETLVAHLDADPKVTSRPKAKETSLVFETFNLMQMSLYDQVVRLLRAISCRFPVLILLDDLQWIDSASASLLFYLGGHLSGRRILLLGAYRPEDMALAEGLGRHPLVAVLNEFQRRFGEIQVDLPHGDGRAFVDAYLDCQPNHFDQDFREILYRHTCGNALYTVELLLAMQARGEVVQDDTGHWIPKSSVDWVTLPARVKAVISERLGRLDGKCLDMLKAASMQGEIFTAEVVAQVLGIPEEEITTRLSGPLCKQHLLVSPLQLGKKKDEDYQAYYQFRSLLLHKYLVQNLDSVERGRLQRAVVSAEKSYRTNQGAVVT